MVIIYYPVLRFQQFVINSVICVCQSVLNYCTYMVFHHVQYCLNKSHNCFVLHTFLFFCYPLLTPLSLSSSLSSSLPPLSPSFPILNPIFTSLSHLSPSYFAGITSFTQMETEMIDKLDLYISGGNGDAKYRQLLYLM